ncbi:putative sodium-dependent multivitamin transporter [Pogonomyrmex barbatus]|uniref:Sodium-dependent multivitamin transporter n=1 Tax=Pogonomyrmex barbatus TaxID=144034 RepID=A0A6I9WRR7_9HYME|nr:putative sodium-dependent multivitamin transporter [Pogonomyrmex barbatus]
MAALTAADYAVIGVLILISSAIGMYYWLIGGRQKSTEEYFMANKSMRVIPVAIGLMVSYLSAVSLLGVSSENYLYGTQYAVINISYGVATPFAAYFYLPVFFRLDNMSAFEYLQKRFGTTTRLIASFAFLLQLLLYTGVVLYAPALALEATTNISRTASVIGLGLICTFYSTIGVIVTAAIHSGGLDQIWQIAREGSRLEFDNISPDPTVRHTWWNLLLGGFFTYLSLYGVNQVQVQRLLTISNLAAAQRALWWSWPMSSIMSLTLCFSGLAIYSKYYKCDPLNEGRISSNDQLMPLYVMDTLSNYPGVPGLFIAGIFSAGLSTISATINSLAAVILQDYIKPFWRVRNGALSATTSIIISKVLALVVGLSCVGVAFLAQFLGGLLQAALTIFGVVGGPMLGLYTLGMFFPSSNQKGAIMGFVLSLMFSLWIGFGQPKPPISRLNVSTDGCEFNNTTMYHEIDGKSLIYSNLHYENQLEEEESYFYLYRISYMWYCPLGFLLTIITGWIVSWITNCFLKGDLIEIDPILFSPIVAGRIQKRKEADKYRNTITLNKS